MKQYEQLPETMTTDSLGATLHRQTSDKLCTEFPILIIEDNDIPAESGMLDTRAARIEITSRCLLAPSQKYNTDTETDVHSVTSLWCCDELDTNLDCAYFYNSSSPLK
ncbi:hypothetical protein J6590_003076 [Homalodisca vitripennis]|nr:hypothetical protein J6590_003076 [Homalodisca vitripennis]